MKAVLIGGPENSNEVHVGVDQHTVRHIIATLDATYEHTYEEPAITSQPDGFRVFFLTDTVVR